MSPRQPQICIATTRVQLEGDRVEFLGDAKAISIAFVHPVTGLGAKRLYLVAEQQSGAVFVPGNEPVTRTVNRLYLADAVALEDSPEVGDRLGELLIGSLMLAPDRAEQITLGYASSPARHQRPKQACEAGR